MVTRSTWQPGVEVRRGEPSHDFHGFTIEYR